MVTFKKIFGIAIVAALLALPQFVRAQETPDERKAEQQADKQALLAKIEAVKHEKLKTALALDSLIRGQFPRDALYVIGFADVAFELTQTQLPGLRENDYVQGTNYEMALSLARRLLARHRGGNRQILFITDGEPTACLMPNGQPYFAWPPRPIVRQMALLEAARCARLRP